MKASVTPEVFIFDQKEKKVYSGSFFLDKEEKSSIELLLQKLINQEEFSSFNTVSPGCSIKRNFLKGME